MATGLPVLLVTANVGSIFEEPSVMLKGWTEEFLSTVSRLDPKFIALHCQEVGGKNYEQSMQHVEYFVRLLMSSDELRLFDRVRVFLDEDYSSAEHFTALGNFYFIHNSVKDVMLWDFRECTFVPVNGKEVHSGNIEEVTTKEKAKFPQDFFPECKWSRKGFLRTRWSISETVLDLINIHLFHDASNLVAMETFPSVYSKTRRRALEHTLDKFHNDQYPNVPYFVFGDFNFRTDTCAVIQKLTEDTHEDKVSSKGVVNKVQYRNKKDDLVLTLGKKEFSHYEHQHVFNEDSGQWLREYDKELGDFEGRLFEFPIRFVPSYPFQEDIKGGTHYMQTRVPAWCDRVLLSPTAKSLVEDVSTPDVVKYGIIGGDTCMGDHKPVYLRVLITTNAGKINCCSLPNAPEFCFQVSTDLLSMLPDYRSCSGARALAASNYLHATPTKHDPYTPDSMDSPSPNMLTMVGEISDVDLDNSVEVPGPSSATVHSSIPARLEVKRRVDRAVSPSLLKSRLEIIVRNNNKLDDSTREMRAQFRRSPSEYYLSKWSNSELAQVEMRKTRSNSDISWQKTEHSDKSWLPPRTEKRSSNIRPRVAETLVIPKIAIINASNYESDASSVHIHDDRHSICSSTYSESRTKTISGSGLSREKSEEFCNVIVDEKTGPDVQPKTREELKTAGKQASCDSNVIEALSLSETGISRTDSKPELASKTTSRSNSIQSQHTDNNTSVNLSLKAYNKVTERCKKNISGKGKCQCCSLF